MDIFEKDQELPEEEFPEQESVESVQEEAVTEESPAQEPETEALEDEQPVEDEQFAEEVQPVEEAQPAEEQPEEAPVVTWGEQVERKYSPYADSPYETAFTPGVTVPKKKKAKKASAGRWPGRILAAVLTVALVISACAVTAQVVNRQWETEYQQLQGQMQNMQSYLEGLIEENSSASTGNSVSGSPVATDGLTPSQVYAQNVDSVVSITTDLGSGTGFVISEDGYVLSNYHVVEGANRIFMTLYDGRQFALELKGYYEQGDVALLKAEAEGLQAVTLGSSDDLIVGDMVVAIGNPLGELTATLTVGYVSGKDRLVTTDGSATNMIQTDAAINAGNSGGPLFNMKGEVIGITSAKYTGTTSSGALIEGLGFAIPIADVESVLGDLMEHGYVTGQAYMGIMVYTVQTTMGNIGCCVDSTTPGGAADRAGIQAGDIITGIDDYEITTLEELTMVLTKYKAGDTVKITVLRNWRTIELTLTFDEKTQS